MYLIFLLLPPYNPKTSWTSDREQLAGGYYMMMMMDDDYFFLFILLFILHTYNKLLLHTVLGHTFPISKFNSKL